MKIIAFAQLRNEIEKGNLENWFRSVSVCDFAYVYDQASTDGSQDYYKHQEFVEVSAELSKVNDFKNESLCKSRLLEKLLLEHPDADWILWIDGDTILDARLQKREALEKLLSSAQSDAISLGHYNLWRNDLFYRTDNAYHGHQINALWKNTGKLHFKVSDELHKDQHPEGLETSNVFPGPVGEDKPYSLIHRGFATDYQLLLKFEIYKSFGQDGWELHRLLNEEGLTLEKMPYWVLPEWYPLSIHFPDNKINNTGDLKFEIMPTGTMDKFLKEKGLV